jgi:hypothetical protein
MALSKSSLEQFKDALGYLNSLPQTPLIDAGERVDEKPLLLDTWWVIPHPMRPIHRGWWNRMVQDSMEPRRRNFVNFVERGAECGTEDEVNEILKYVWNMFNFIWLQCFETAMLNKIKYTSKTMEARVYARVGVSHDDIMYLVRNSTRLHKEDPELLHANIYYMLARVFQALPDEPEGFLQLATDTPSVKSANKA